MDKLISIRIDDTPTGMRVTGYVARQKNRARVWTIDVDKADKQMIPDWVQEREDLRKKNAEA